MECKITKERIREGIINTVKDMATATELFEVQEDRIIAKRPIPVSEPLSPEQERFINDSVQYADTIEGEMYRNMFKGNPEEFLRYIAQQANSSTSESRGAMNIAGEEIFEAAMRVFPNEGLMSPERDAAEKINEKFGEDVLLKSGINQWGISPPPDLVLKYMMAQEGGWEAVANEMRSRYLSQFSSVSSNLMGDDLWLGHPILENPTIQKLTEFARKINPDFRIEVVEDLDQNAVSLIRDNIIYIRQGSIIDELPEEISHFFFELLPNDHPLRKEMMDKIVDLSIYSKTFQQYKDLAAYQKNGRPDIDKIKREAVAKQIAEYIKSAYRDEADTKYGNKRGLLKDLIHRFMKWLRRSFHSVASPIYSEPIVEVNNPFKDAAEQVMRADISSMSITKQPSLYDSIFFSAIEDALDEGYEASTVAKNLHQFAKTLKNQVVRTFMNYVQKGNMKAVEEQLQDPNNPNYNRIFDIVSQLDATTNILAEMVDTDNLDKATMFRVTSQLADAYHEMEQIPRAIGIALKKMKTDKVEDQIIDNMAELQTYFQFSDAFRNITNEYVGMLSYLKGTYAQKDNAHIYDRMIERMGNTSTEFAVVDQDIMKMLQNHVLNLMEKWTEEAFRKYNAQRDAEYTAAETQFVKNKILTELKSKITSVEQLRQAVTGNFPDAKDLKLADGTKVDIKRIRDMSQIDYIVFLFSSPTLVADPFVSNLMANYTDRYVAGQFKGDRDAKIFADMVLPIKAKLASQGVGWYEAELAIQNVQNFYDNSLEGKVTQKRVLLSATNRFDFQYDKQVKNQEIVDLSREIGKIQGKFNDGTFLPGDVDNTAKLEKLIKERDDKREEYNKWLADWSNRPFTDEYYAKVEQMRDKKTDSEVLRKIKDINRKLLSLEEQQYAAVAILGIMNMNDEHFDVITQEIALLQNEKSKLLNDLPPAEKSVYDTMEELYEIDEVATQRMRQRHKNQWVKSLKNSLIAAGTNIPSNELEKKVSDNYDELYTVNIPTKEFFDKRAAIFEQIQAITSPEQGLEALSTKLQELMDREKKLLRPFRDLRNEINVNSFKYLSIEKDEYGQDILLSQSLKNLEEEIDLTRNKIALYSRILSSAANESDKMGMRSLVELLSSFGMVTTHALEYKAEDVQKIFAHITPLTTSQAEQILSATRKGLEGDNSEYNNLSSLRLTEAAPGMLSAFRLIQFVNPQIVLDAETILYKEFKSFTRLDSNANASRAALYAQLNEMYTNSMSLQYYIAMREFRTLLDEYINDDSFNTAAKDIHALKAGSFSIENIGNMAEIELFFADGLFESVLAYMMYKERNEQNPSSAYPLADLVDFYLSIHKQKTTWVDGEPVTTYTPISYVKRIAPVDPELFDGRPPRFLQRNRVKDQFRTEKVNELDSRVTSGQMEANVDLNGQWLPLVKKDSPYFNKEYDKLVTSKDAVDKNKLDLLNTIKGDYMKKQVEHIPEGERLDTVIPSKRLDKLEEKKLMMTNAQQMWEYVRNITPFAGRDQENEEEIDYREEIGAITAKNRDIYTGAVIAENAVKLRSRRRIKLARTSSDVTSSMLMFIEDINEYHAKNEFAPVMKSFSDVFKRAHELNPYANKHRKGVLTDLYLTKTLDEVPDNFANNPNLAKALSFVNKLTTMRLLGDPLGALVNLTSGAVQQLIEANFGKKELKMYMQSGAKAATWFLKYEQDYQRQSNWGKETQIISMLRMMPDSMDLSNQVSKANIYANVRGKLMYVRSATEKQLAIHLGLSLLLSEPILHNGVTVSPEDLYELDPINNLLRLKDEYKSLDEDWNPETGKKIRALRRKITQFYTLQQGNFFKQNQSYISTMAVGKTGELMKRWFATGVIRRFQGEVVNDPMTGESRKGYHLAMLHLLRDYVGRILKGDVKGATEYWNVIAKRQTEKMGYRKALAEFLYVGVFAFLATVVLGYDEDDEDKNEKLREMNYWKQLALLVALRVQGELGTFIPVPVLGLGYMEMKRAILDPIGLPKASVDNIMGLVKLGLEQMLTTFGIANYDRDLTYQKGKPYGYWAGGLGAFKDEGDSKLKALILNTIGYTGYTFEPAEYIKTLTQMQNRIK